MVPESNSVPQLSLTHVNSPTLTKCSTPFHSTIKASAATLARYYSVCTLDGISPEAADKATMETVSWFHGWWKQDRFKENEKKGFEKKRKSIQLNHITLDQQQTFENLNSQDQTSESFNHPIISNRRISRLHIIPDDRAMSLKRNVLSQLQAHEGDVSNCSVVSSINALAEVYDPLSKVSHSGNWTIINKPKFKECLGTNSNGEYMYTLGRMCFDMFPRSDLKCSIRGTFNVIDNHLYDANPNLQVRLPKIVRKQDVKRIMTYNITVAFNIEEKGLKGILTNYGYILPDPDIPQRCEVWFSDGVLEQDPDSIDSVTSPEWMELFQGCNVSMAQRAKLLALRLILGAKASGEPNVDGSMEYSFSRPVVGYIDVMYQDETLRIVKGNHGSIHVLYKL